jgi:hypothetical protein
MRHFYFFEPFWTHIAKLARALLSGPNYFILFRWYPVFVVILIPRLAYPAVLVVIILRLSYPAVVVFIIPRISYPAVVVFIILRLSYPAVVQ